MRELALWLIALGMLFVPIGCGTVGTDKADQRSGLASGAQGTPIEIFVTGSSKDDLGDGWSELSLYVAVVNMDAQWHDIWSPSAFGATAQSAAIIQTAEGYSYQVPVGGGYYPPRPIPPGFQISGSQFSTPFRAKVASKSSGYSLSQIAYWDTPFGSPRIQGQEATRTIAKASTDASLLPSSAIVQPVTEDVLPIYGFGDTFALSEIPVEVSVTPSDKHGEFNILYRNLNEGYETRLDLSSSYLVDSNNQMCLDRPFTRSQSVVLGPGQTEIRPLAFALSESATPQYIVLLQRGHVRVSQNASELVYQAGYVIDAKLPGGAVE